MSLETIDALVGAALALGADQVRGWSQAERALAAGAARGYVSPALVRRLGERIRAGDDPLGEAFARIRAAERRRALGQTYTPAPIVASMVRWAAAHGQPVRVVDPGTGSGRYLLAAGRQFPGAALTGADIDPVATTMARGNLAAAGLAERAEIVLADYRGLTMGAVGGSTLYLGNPPYVRHHQIEPVWKQWLVQAAAERGLPASQLAGLHVHFFLATARLGHPGDYGAFITSAEWLDVNYGRLVRELLLDGLGGTAIHVLEPTLEPFPGTATTGAITCFMLGTRPTSVRLRRVARMRDLGRLEGGRAVARGRLAAAARWSPLTRAARRLPAGFVELGEVCRVHRGAVTGANDIWVMARGTADLPERVLFASVTRARELFAAGTELADTGSLRVVVDLPADLDVLETTERRQVDRFLRRARAAGGADGYIARTRRAWWSIGLRAPAPLLATYMARRPPAFVRNLAGARHINIAHGIYPREHLPEPAIARLAEHLRVSVSLSQGRTYAGGLTKFEPREMERLPVPAPDRLLAP
jgi:adenine-specific DNA-methyltransferase